MKNLDTYKILKKKVLFRADLNVPVSNGKITDFSRINSIIPSLRKLIISKNKVFILAHLGRPRGKLNKKYSLKFLCTQLKISMRIPKIYFLESFDDKLIKDTISKMQYGEICLFENTRFNIGEESNDLNFAKKLSSNFDIFVNDAFSASHRNHSSIVGLPNFLPAVAGLSFINEIKNLNNFLTKSKKPNIAIIGGSKISTKIKVIYNLLEIFDTIVIAGAMANTFLLANNLKIGKSLAEIDFIDISIDIIEKAKLCNCEIVLPLDAVCSTDLKNKDNIRMCKINDVSDDHMILDIGKKTKDLICEKIIKSRSLLWNGPLGAFEHKPFDKCSIDVANTISKHSKDLQIEAMAGGGDTIALINLAEAQNGFKYLSNAGGAFLEWLEGNKSPGAIAIEKNNL